MMNQALITADPPDIEAAAREVWRQTKNDSADYDWDAVIAIRKDAYRQIAVAVLTAAGCTNGLIMMPSTKAASGDRTE